MNKNSLIYETAKFLMQAGQVRDSSLKLYLTARCNDRANASRALTKLLNENLIEKKRYNIKKSSNNRTGFDDVYFLTSKGKDFILENEEDDYYRLSYKDFEKRFATRQGEGIPYETERIEKALGDNDVLAMISACGVPVFTHDKPSLIYLKSVLLGNASYPKKGYLDNLTKEECVSLLKSGIYYSISELLDFAAFTSSGLTDTITGSRARGIFLSNNTCYPIYISKKYDNRLLRVNQKGENGLVEFLESLSSFTDIYKKLPEFNEYVIDPLGNKKIKNLYRGKPYALILSDGAMLAYAVSTGNAKGKAKTYSKAYSETNWTLRQSGAKTSTLLTASSPFFERIYIVPMSLNGYYSLYYLLTHSLSELRENGLEILADDARFQKEEGSTEIYPYIESSSQNPVCFMPVVEAKELYNISRGNSTPVFVTFKDHMDIIARSVRKDCLYYDADSGSFAGADDVLIYDYNGRPKGMVILDSYLNGLGKTFDKNTEGYRIPKKFGMSYTAFYNAIARGEISPETAADKTNTKDYEPQTRHYKKTVIVSCSMNKDMSEELKRRAQAEGITVSRILVKALKNYLKSPPY